MKVFSILASAAVLSVMTSMVDAQRLLRSEASTETDSTVSTADFSTLSSGSGFTPGNVEAQSSFGALDQEGSTGGNRPSGSMQGGAGRGFGGSGHGGMQNVGSGEGFGHGSGSFGGHGGFGGHGRSEESFSGGDFAGSFGGHGFGGSGFSGGDFGGSFNGEMPSIGSGEAPTGGSGETPAAATTTTTTSSVAASSSA
ncbi:hypothetical protein V7S43_010760 [Phytophthora oleae]|uniref:RxLR effector protein n=1 Tax=Phytophthora oleae TaxID=2107226 RepID=A0ABD3FCI9_9STRA